VPRLRPSGGRGDRNTGFTPEVTPTLMTALRYFVLATAARRVRGRGTPHSTMLIHTTMLTDVHEKFRGPLVRALADLREALIRQEAGLVAELQQLWNAEQTAIPPADLGEVPVPFEALREHLVPVLDAVRVIVDNYRSTERLDYTGPPRTAVVIGG